MTGSIAAALSLWTAPAAAQPSEPEPYSLRPGLRSGCGQRPGGEIVVCGRRERSRYRIPPPPDHFDPAGPTPSVSAERHSLYEVGDSGIHSCSAVGPGGYTGCTFKAWKRDREQWAGKRPRPPRPSAED